MDGGSLLMGSVPEVTRAFLIMFKVESLSAAGCILRRIGSRDLEQNGGCQGLGLGGMEVSL